MSKFTNITVTAAENSVPDDKEVEFTPCWTLTPSALAQGSSLNAVTVTENDFGYVTFTARRTGDPTELHRRHVHQGRSLAAGQVQQPFRHSAYAAVHGAGRRHHVGQQHDRVPIAANGSGWTYVIVDMATNQFYDKENQTVVQHFRFDPLEARTWSGGSYQFTGRSH